jgi:hypothetical protein
MTGPTIRSKRSNDLTLLLTAAGALALAAVAAPFSDAQAATPMPKLPVIQTVGVIPLEWDDGGGSGAGDLEPARLALEQIYPRAVRDSRRFRVLGDDLVAGAWHDAAGRQEMREEFELQAYLGLNAAPRDDVVVLTARLLDADLKTLLLEADTVPRSWLASAKAEGEDSLKDRVERLVYRLVNRIPVDVSVTSVQGTFVTLSGGTEQGVEIGDQVDLVRTSIRAVHPANGTWLEFDKRPLGKAQVVDVKTWNSVAKLTSLVKENAVEVGDGARIGAIAARVKFQRAATTPSYADGGKQDAIVVPPLYYGNAPAAKPEPKPAPSSGLSGQLADNAAANAAQMDQAVSDAQAAPVEEPTAEHPAQTNASPEAAPVEEGPSVWQNVTADATSHKILDEANFYVGPYWWSVKGPANSSGKFPLWLLNSVGGGVSRTLLFKFKTAFGGGIMVGKTPAGSYVGYDSHARIYWEDELYLADGLVRYWRAGGVATFSGMSVPDGSYGGGDWIRGGGFGHLGGTVHLGDVGGGGSGRYDWFGEYALMPLNIGRVGYDGSRKVVESALGWRLSLGAYEYQPPHVVQWGGGFEYSDERQTLKNGRRPHFQEYSLKLLAKYAF